MDAALIALATISAVIWAGFALLPWNRWRNDEILRVSAKGAADLESLSDITVLMPARNEARVIEQTLRSLVEQAPHLKVILIDDGSEDATVERAGRVNLPNLQVIRSAGLPAGWSGKLWALEQGRRNVMTPYALLLDADIELAPGMISALREKMRREGFQLISVMAMPSMSGVWEKLLMPAFVYFFKVLYPFRMVNSRAASVAAAAGGCILLETRALSQIGGFGSIKSAVIDDCALAKQIKSHGFRIWLGLTRSARSIRGYLHLTDLWDMVARTAFAQLRYSTALLVLCTLVMALAYWAPVMLLAFSDGQARLLSLAAMSILLLTYLPTLRFYERSYAWAICLPFIALLFLAMTWTSAIRYWRGERTRWKGRIYSPRGVTSRSKE